MTLVENAGVVGACDRTGALVEPFDHVMLRIKKDGGWELLVLPKWCAGAMAIAISSVFVPERPAP